MSLLRHLGTRRRHDPLCRPAVLLACFLFATPLALPADPSDPDFAQSDSPEEDPANQVMVLTPQQSTALELSTSCTRVVDGAVVSSCSDDEAMVALMNTPQILGQPRTEGYAVCGGLDEAGRPQPRCGSVAATHLGPSLGGCSDPGEAAVLVRGKFTCMQCPPGYRWTIHNPRGERACRKGVFSEKQYSPATETHRLLCSDGEFFSLTRGGSCWSCPPFSERARWARPGSENACQFSGPIWQSPVYIEPGIHGLPGGPELILLILRDPTLVNLTMDEMARQEGIQDIGAFKQDQWNLIRSDPSVSPVVNAIAMTMVIAGASDPNAPPELRSVIAGFESYIVARRTFMAQDALNAYDNWYKASELRAAEEQSELMYLFHYGTVPIDFQAQMSRSMTGAGLIGPALFTGAMENIDFTRRLFPGACSDSGCSKSLAALSKRISDLRRRVQAMRSAVKTGTRVTAAVAQSAGGLAGSATTALLTMGPQIVMAASFRLVTEHVERFVKIETARPKLLRQLEQAGEPADLAAMLSTDRGVDEFLTYWGLMSDPTDGTDYLGAHLNQFAEAARIGMSQAGPEPVAASSHCEICLYGDADFQGASACFTEDVLRLGLVDMWNQASSLRFVGDGCSGVSATLFSRINLRGDSINIYNDVPWLGALPRGQRGKEDWNDSAASVKYQRD